MKTIAIFALWLAYLTTAEADSARQNSIYPVDLFSKETEINGLPKGWKPLVFKKIPKHTIYTLESEEENFFVKATSSQSASAIYKEVSPDLSEYPVLTWRWKITNVLEKADPAKKSGDDYSARIYVAFEYNPKKASLWEKTKYGTAKSLYGAYPPKGALNYVWDNKLPIGTTLDNAYTDRAKMIVLETGKEKAGQWVWEGRNVYEDYKKLFNEEPPKISFVAVMTDTDNTGEIAQAYFDDIAFIKADETNDQKTCESKGGHWGRFGLLALEQCNFSTKDAGKECMDNSQCESVCVAQENVTGSNIKGKCYGQTVTLGTCLNYVQKGEAMGMLCTD